MDRKEKLKDLGAAGFALAGWFQSQDLTLRDGAWIMMQMLAEILADMADSGNHLEQGLRIARHIIEQRAHESYCLKQTKQHRRYRN
jgi:hypothetical protein